MLWRILDVFPPDNFVTQLIQQKKLDITLEEIKDLVQTMVEVLPLKEDDPKRIQTEKAFVSGKILNDDQLSYSRKVRNGGMVPVFEIN
jgi:hypothetical protein